MLIVAIFRNNKRFDLENIATADHRLVFPCNISLSTAQGDRPSFTVLVAMVTKSNPRSDIIF